MFKKVSLLFCSVVFLSNLYAQEALTPRPSPAAMVTMKYHDSYVKITYSQPHKKGRVIFGDLVPYGKIWRTGANETTEITLTNDIIIGGNQLKSGTYSLFTIPEKDHWTIIVNRELGQWGAYNYNERADELRFEVPSTQINDVVWEPFTIAFEQRNKKADLVMMWETTKVSIPIEFLK